MNFSSFFGFADKPKQLPLTPDDAPAQVPKAPDSSCSESAETGVFGSKINFPYDSWLLPTQASWINDQWHLRIWEKSRQVGATKTDALDSVLKANPGGARFDVWVTSRDEVQARLY